MCLLVVCWHGVHSAAHECGLTLLQRTEKGAGDFSARLRLLCSPRLTTPCGARGQHMCPPHGFSAWAVSSKASYPQWICFLCRKQIERGEFKDKPSPIESRERGRSRRNPAAAASETVAAGVAEHPAFSLERRASHAVERFHSNKKILCF